VPFEQLSNHTTDIAVIGDNPRGWSGFPSLKSRVRDVNCLRRSWVHHSTTAD